MKNERVIILNNVKVYAFVGRAGTGKSQRAQYVASIFDADFIIDDGLVIRKGSIVCGRSAKSELNQVRAIRRALFEFEDHRNEVVNFFSKSSPCSVMIIATSDAMIHKIVTKLGMNDPSKTIYIEDVSTPEEIAKARRERYGKGQHVIPVSHVLVRKNFAGKLVGQLRVFWKSKDNKEGDKTIVRPPFSFYGQVHIEPEAISQIVSFVATSTSQVAAADDIKISMNSDDLSISLKITVMMGASPFTEVAKNVKERIAVSVRYFTGLDVKNVNITISKVLM